MARQQLGLGKRVEPASADLQIFVRVVELGSLSAAARERDVLGCLMAGYSNKVIARELDVCEATVKVHVKAILRKLDVSNRTQAAIWASTRGFANSGSSAQQRMQMAHH